MKRLRYYLLNMTGDNETYKEMYDGKMREPTPDGFIEHNHPMYWDDTIGYMITKSNRIELSKPTVTISIPIHLLGITECNDVTADYTLRRFAPYIDELNEVIYNRKRTDVENGRYYLYKPNNKVQKRNASYFSEVTQKYYDYLGNTTITTIDNVKEIPVYMCLNLVVQIQLPQGKHKKGIVMLTKELPDAVRRYITDIDIDNLEKELHLNKLQENIREWLKQSEYCAFIANGSILPREKNSDNLLKDAVPFISTKEDEITVCGVKGMGFKRGVSVITGGGYSGKSTLLDALSSGIYNHILSDGRELVITDNTAMKISAEDGRSVQNENITPFVQWIPNGDSTKFSTEHASGSTSQAANVMEAVVYGCRLLMIDEDKSATNFMIRDNVMKKVIPNEPIVPFVERVKELYEETQTSTILVIGGCSDFLAAADNIYTLNDYKISCITKEAKQVRTQYSIQDLEQIEKANWINSRLLKSETLTTYPEDSKTEYLAVSDMGFLFIGDERVDIRMLHNVSSLEQLSAIAFLIRKIANKINKKFVAKAKNDEVEEYIIPIRYVENMIDELEGAGLESIYSTFFTECGRWLEMPRKYEVLAVLNRMRFIEFQ